MLLRCLACWSAALVSASIPAATLDPTLYAQCHEFVQQETVPEKAVKRCRPLADSAHPGALYVYGLILWNTKSGGADEALTVLRKAAGLGHPPAHYFLARIYQDNQVTRAQPSMADHARFAYCAGFPEAQELKPLLAEAGSGNVACEDEAQHRYEGAWTGELQLWQAPGEKASAKGKPSRFRITVDADRTARAQQWEDDQWLDLKTLRAQETDGVLILQSTEAGWDFDGKWVESWTLQLLPIDPDRVRVHWTRAVTNLHLPASYSDKTFVQAGGGEFRRETVGGE